jgi:hypothetical protein
MLCLSIVACCNAQTNASHLSSSSLAHDDWFIKAICRPDERDASRVLVDGIIYLRKPSTIVGSNLGIVVNRRDAATGDWTSLTWTGLDGQADGIKWCIEQWQLPESEVDRWEIDVPALSYTAPLAPQPFENGVLADDPMSSVVALLPNAEDILRWLEDAGYGAAALPWSANQVAFQQHLTFLAASFAYGESTEDAVGAMHIALNTPPASEVPLPDAEYPWNWRWGNYRYISKATIFYPNGQVCSPVKCVEVFVEYWTEQGQNKQRRTRTTYNGESVSVQVSGDTMGTLVTRMHAEWEDACYTQTCNRIEQRKIYDIPTDFWGRPDTSPTVIPTITPQYRLVAFTLQCCVPRSPCLSPPGCLLQAINSNPPAWGPTVPTIPVVIP